MCIQSSGNFLIDYDKYVWRGFYVCQPYMKDELYSNCKKIGLPIPWILFYGFSWKTMAKNFVSGFNPEWCRRGGVISRFFCFSWNSVVVEKISRQPVKTSFSNIPIQPRKIKLPKSREKIQFTDFGTQI